MGKREIPSYVARYGATLAYIGHGWVCHYCHIPLKRGSFIDEPQFLKEGYGLATVDHRIPLIHGGLTEFDNLCLCCRQCNLEKDYQEYSQFYASKAGARAYQEKLKKRGLARNPTQLRRYSKKNGKYAGKP